MSKKKMLLILSSICIFSIILCYMLNNNKSVTFEDFNSNGIKIINEEKVTFIDDVDSTIRKEIDTYIKENNVKTGNVQKHSNDSFYSDILLDIGSDYYGGEFWILYYDNTNVYFYLTPNKSVDVVVSNN